VVGFDTRQIRREFGVKYLHDYLGHIGLRHGHTTLIDDEEQTGYYVHYIDWAVKRLGTGGIGYRDFFSKEIESAKRELKKTAGIGAVIVIGFTGYYNRANLGDELNEELSPVIRSILGKVPVFHFLHQRQLDAASGDPNKLYLWNAVKSVDDHHAKPYADASQLLLDLICGRRMRLRRRLEATYESDWVNGKLFMNPSRL
jgi:hypothetical protein